jgi:predicted PurR-regulated permease PerM
MASPRRASTAGAVDLKRQLTFWSGALIVLIALLWLLNDVLLPFIAGMALAYLLDPLVKRVQRLGVNRAIAAVAVVVVVIIVLVAAVIVIAPILGEQIAGFIDRSPTYIERVRALIVESSKGWLGTLIGERFPDAQKQLGGVAASAAGWIGGFLGSLWTGGRALLSLISLLVIMPIVAFYMLIDWERMVATVDSWIPRQHRDTVRQLAREMDGAISGFVRGQALVCLILGSFYSIALIAIGLHFGLLIGITAAVLGFAPYIGTMTGFLLATGVAVAQFWPDWSMVLMAAGIFVIGQAIEGNVLQPLLVGKQIGLHPVWLMFALFAFGYLLGFVGLLIAVPVAAAIGVLIRFLIRQYLASPYYTG